MLRKDTQIFDLRRVELQVMVVDSLMTVPTCGVLEGSIGAQEKVRAGMEN